MIADLHLHGKYARATSKDLTLQMLEKYGKIKGIDILGTGDFTHPAWNKHIKESLTEISGTGIYQTKGGQKFAMQTEISLVYTQGRGRRVHVVVLAPSIEVVDQITEALLKRGRVDYDGRPIFKISCIEFVDMMRSISKDIEVIPAHAWTPWFGLFGSKSGFDTLQEAFGDNTKHVHAIETGMSSDPPMNWRLKQLDGIQLVSFSDSHSFWPWRIGREATIFEMKEANYKEMLNSIRTGNGLKGTIETDPGYGIYHYDGHRNCNVVYSPEESKKRNFLCEKCGSKVTVGVAARVDELADRPEGYRPANAKEYKDLIPLSELIAGTLGVGIATKKPWEVFNKMISAFGTEFRILLDATEEELAKVVDPELVKTIIKNRNQQIKVLPGYDGVYGVPIIGDSSHASHKQKVSAKQKSSPKKQTPLDKWT